MRFATLFLSLAVTAILAGCASETPKSGECAMLHVEALEIDQECLKSAPKPADTFDIDLDSDDEIYVSAVPAPAEGEIFALAVENDVEDTLRSLRKKEAFIDKRARFLGYEDGK